MRNASLDVDYLRERGIVGLRHRHARGGAAASPSTARGRVGADPRGRQAGDARGPRAARGPLAARSSASTSRRDARAGRARAARRAMVAPARAFGMDVIAWSENLTAERAAECRRSSGHPRGAARAARRRSRSTSCSRSARRGLFGAAELGRDEAHRGADQHLARADRRRAGAHRRAARGHDRRRRPRRLRHRAAARRPSAHPLRERRCCCPTSATSPSRRCATMYGQVVEDIAAWRAGSPLREI